MSGKRTNAQLREELADAAKAAAEWESACGLAQQQIKELEQQLRELSAEARRDHKATPSLRPFGSLLLDEARTRVHVSYVGASKLEIDLASARGDAQFVLPQEDADKLGKLLRELAAFRGPDA